VREEPHPVAPAVAVDVNNQCKVVKILQLHARSRWQDLSHALGHRRRSARGQQ
jgi:hypothetical protein